MAWTWGAIEEGEMTFKRQDTNKTMTFKKMTSSTVTNQGYLQPENALGTINALAAIAGVSFVLDSNAKYTLVNVPTEEE